MPVYEDVQVLLICWENAIETFKDQRMQLERVLQSYYNFGTKPIDIPKNKPDKFLGDEIHEFMGAHDKEQNLLIVYYGGHGAIKEGQLILKWSESILPPCYESHS